MLLRRIDDLVPGGGSLDLHPRLTLLRAAGPEPRRRLELVVRALADGRLPIDAGVAPPAATVELSGVELVVDQAMLERLEIDQRVDPVLVLGGDDGLGTGAGAGTEAAPVVRAADDAASSGAATVPDAAARAATGSAPPPYRPSESAAGAVTLEGLRSELRRIGERHSELGARMESARSRRDSFSTAALEVCVGQIEALESRRAEVRAQVEQRQQDVAERSRSLLERVERLRSDLDRTDGLDATAVLSARAALVAAIEAPVLADPAAVALADQLDAALHAVRRAHAERSAAELRVREARQRFETASSELEGVRAARPSDADPDTVARLEAVRDEIFDVSDRGVRRSPGRAKRRLQELRAEEAVLLDRLGFDTYSAYVMGITSVRADVERSNRVVRAEGEVEQVRAELEELRRGVPDDAQLERVGSELEALVLVATRELDPAAPLPALATMDLESRSELVYGLIEALRDRRVTRSGVEDPAVRAAADSLHAALVDATPRLLEPDEHAPTAPPASAPVEELLAAADAWSSWQRGVAAWREGAERQLDELEAELAELDRQDTSSGAPVAEWAELEAALDAALDRLAEAQERVRVHELATAELAELREAELELRSRERSVLSSIAATEARRPAERAAPAGAGATGSAEGPSVASSTAEVPGPPAPAVTAEPADDAHWRLLDRLARQRRVSYVGALPLLVEGLGPIRSRDLVRARLARMSDLVQVVVLSDDEDDVAWARGLGAAAAVVDLPGRR